MTAAHHINFIRFHYHVTFAIVVLGALLFAREVTIALWASLFLLYLVFNVLLYGGIYTLNDIADAKSDETHPLKRNRPLPSRRVSLESARFFSLILISAGLLSAFVIFDIFIFYICVAILVLNIFYTFVAKKIPYLELIANSATHSLRFLMGMLLVTDKAASYLPLLAVFFLALGFACVRRAVEKDVDGWESRKTLKYYSGNSLFIIQLLSFAAVAFVSLTDKSIPKAVYLPILALWSIMVFGTYFSKRIRSLFKAVWTK